jgi:hypothetical protein
MRQGPPARLRNADVLDGQRGAESIRRLKTGSARATEPQPSAARRATTPLLAAMRARNWVTGLVIPIVTAVAVGIVVVVVAGANSGSGGSVPSTLSAGFPPARNAAADFSGAKVAVDAVASSGATEVAAGSGSGSPALWRSMDGGSTWARATGATGATPAALGRARQNQLASVTPGPAGWLAVGGGTTANGTAAAGDGTTGGGAASAAGRPVVVGSADGKTWTSADGEAAFTGDGLVTSAAAAGPAGYVIVGRQASSGGSIAVAWYSRGLTGWRVATDARTGALEGDGDRQMNAVTATAKGFVAAGSAGTRPAAWLSASGRTWSAVVLPLPAGAARAELRYVAASRNTVAAAGTATTAGGRQVPFAAVSANDGASWSETLLPVPRGGAAEVTALTGAGGGFTAAGTYGRSGAQDVVVWLLPAGAAPAAAWTAATPEGMGLTGRGAQAITALTSAGTTMTGVGFAGTAASGEPTIWQSPVRS